MTASQPKTHSDEFKQQRDMLFSKVGEPGSGYARYSAAMYFYMNGVVSSELLEIYRRCCKFDSENPIALANHEGIETAFNVESIESTALHQ